MATIINGSLVTVPLELVQFDTSVSPPPHAEGLLYWDTVARTVSVMTDITGVVLQVGQEIHARVVNNSGVQIDNGFPVYISGANGSGLPTIVAAQADDVTTSVVLGLATEDIVHGATGIVAVFGLVRDVDTSGFSAGDTLFLDADNAGGLVNVIPDSPNFTVVVGTVLTSDADVGVILVDITQATILSGTIQSKVYSLPLRGVLVSDFFITGEFRTQSAGETGDYATDFPVNNQHVFLLVNTITGTGDITITGTSLDESDATPTIGDTEVITVDATASQYWQSDKKWWEITNIDIPAGISAINYDVGVVGYTDFGNTNFKIVGYRADAPSGGVNSDMRLRIIKVSDDGGKKMSLVVLEDIEANAAAADQIDDNLRTGGDDRTLNPATSLWANTTVLTLKQGDFDVYFTADENVFQSSTLHEGFILEIQDANNVSFVTLRLDYQLLG